MGARILTGALLAVALPATGAAAAPPEPPSSAPALQDAGPLVARVAEAASEAAEQRARGRSSHAPDPAAAALDQALAALVADGAVGVTARVDTADFDWAGAAGVREIGRWAPARTRDAVRVGSVTKTMVTVLVLQEVERGTWTLDTTLEDVLPGILPAQIAGAVTIEQLLSHRSGAPSTHLQNMIIARMDEDSWPAFVAAQEEDYQDGEHLTMIQALPWEFEPGTATVYSNAGYALLGLMLEEATGQDLGTLLERRVFRPAGMRTADYPDRRGTPGNVLTDTAWVVPEGYLPIDGVDPELFGAAGAVTASTEDLLRFDDALFEGRLLAPETVADIMTPRGALQGMAEYGLGIYRIQDPCAPGEYLYGHDGATFGTLTLNFSSPDGERAFSLGVTGRDLSGQPEPLYDLGVVLEPLLLATC